MGRQAVSVIFGILIIVSMIFAYGILQVQEREYTVNEISPTTFPWMLVTILIVLSISFFIKQWFGPAKHRARVIKGGWIFSRKITTAIIVIALYIVGIQSIGFLWVTPLFLVFLSFLYGTRRPALISKVAVITTFILYLFLKHLLCVHIP